MQYSLRILFWKEKNATHEFLKPEYLNNILSKIKNKVVLTFHGGEPLLIGKENFISLLEIVKRHKEKVDSVFLQSNGTLLDEEWIDIIFNQYAILNIEISLSLDGSSHMNYLRIDYDGHETYEKVLHAYKLLNEYNITAGLLSVISRNSLDKYNEYLSLLKKIPNIKFVKLNPLFNMENNKLTPDSITPSEYTGFIINVSKLYIKNKLYKKFPLEPFLSIIQMLKNRKSTYCNYSKSKCLNFISIYPDGIIGPCDCLPANDFKIELGDNSTIEEALLKGNISNNYSLLNDIIKKCSDCDILDFCNGGCLSQRYYFRYNTDLEKDFCYSKHVLYEFGKEFVKHE